MKNRGGLSFGGNTSQRTIFPRDDSLPSLPLQFNMLLPAYNILSIFEDCHNYIYANEGMLNDKIFIEIVKIIMMKMYDELHSIHGKLRFYVTSGEYRALIDGEISTFTERMQTLYQDVKTEFNKLIISDKIYLKPNSIAYVVSKLQTINLKSTPGDIKGQAFQSFVYKHQRGDRGEYFTPHPVVRLAVEILAPQPNELIIDPACGSGGFLIRCIHYFNKHYHEKDISEYIHNNIRGIEFNPDVAISAILRLAFEGGTGDEVVCSNSLLQGAFPNNSCDIVITNPPFGTRGKISQVDLLRDYSLAHKWHINKKNNWEQSKELLSSQTPEILFIEKCINLLKSGGRMAIVLPDGILQNSSNSHIRSWIRKITDILAVISLPQDTFIPFGTGIKTSLLFIKKKQGLNASGCFMARIKKIGYDVKGQPIYSKDKNGSIKYQRDGSPALDDDIEEIVNAYSEFASQKKEISNENLFIVRQDMLNTRLDVEHYIPMDQGLLDRLHDFKSVRLGELCQIVSRRDSFRRKSNEFIRYIAISDVDSELMCVMQQQNIKVIDTPSRATYRLRKGDIITAVSGASTGTAHQASAYITDTEDGAICSNGFAVLRDFVNVNPMFILAFLKTEIFLRQVRRLMTGHAIPSLSLNSLSTILVPIPPGDFQKRFSEQFSITYKVLNKFLDDRKSPDNSEVDSQQLCSEKRIPSL
jgi:type I restriction enzyme M protein